MGLTLTTMMLSIFRGHIPDSAVRAAEPIAVRPGAVMGVLAAAALSMGLLAAALWATVWLAINLI